MQDLLFHGQEDLRDYFERVKLTAKKKIEGFDANYLLNSSEEDLVRYLVDEYSLDPPVLDPDKKYVFRQSEVDIDVSQDRMRGIFDRSKPFYIKGISVTIAIPFSGDGTYFQYTPSTLTFNPPRGEVIGQEVHLILKPA
jgi:hypothetical protein